jgi:hypothetical protein
MQKKVKLISAAKKLEQLFNACSNNQLGEFNRWLGSVTNLRVIIGKVMILNRKMLRSNPAEP